MYLASFRSCLPSDLACARAAISMSSISLRRQHEGTVTMKKINRKKTALWVGASFALAVGLLAPTQISLFGGGFLLLAVPVTVLRLRPFVITLTRRPVDAFIGLAFLVVCGGLSGALISHELVRSFEFSPFWYYALPAASAASVCFQYATCRFSALIRGLSDDNSYVRRTAAKALGHLGDKRAVDPLIEALSHYDYEVRLAAAEALGRLGDKRAVDPLIEVLADDTGWIRKAAEAALKKLGYKK